MEVHLIGGGWDDALGLVDGHDLAIERVAEGASFDVDALEGVDGLFVGGGPTPAYHASLTAAYPRVRSRVLAGMPYAGFSAGASLAGSHAIIGGWRLDGRPVCPEESIEDLDAVTVVRVAIDEDTRLGPNGAVVGAGRVWHVTSDGATAAQWGGARVCAVSAGQ